MFTLDASVQWCQRLGPHTLPPPWFHHYTLVFILWVFALLYTYTWAKEHCFTLLPVPLHSLSHVCYYLTSCCVIVLTCFPLHISFIIWSGSGRGLASLRSAIVNCDLGRLTYCTTTPTYAALLVSHLMVDFPYLVRCTLASVWAFTHILHSARSSSPRWHARKQVGTRCRENARVHAYLRCCRIGLKRMRLPHT